MELRGEAGEGRKGIGLESSSCGGVVFDSLILLGKFKKKYIRNPILNGSVLCARAWQVCQWERETRKGGDWGSPAGSGCCEGC